MTLRIGKQKTIDTCLSVCLMAFIKQRGYKVPPSEELNILIEGLKFTRWDYMTGHLVYVSSKYNITIEEYIEYPLFFQFLSKYKYPTKMTLHCQKINQKFLISITKNGPVILYVDQFYLDGGFHSSHLVILESLNNETAVILDPWFGKRKVFTTRQAIRSIESLRNNLKISPKVVRII